MKKLLSILCLAGFSVSAIASGSQVQWFHIAPHKKGKIEGGYVFSKTDAEFNGVETESSTTTINLSGEFGFAPGYSVGVSHFQINGSGGEGQGDPSIYVKMRMNQFLGQLTYTISKPIDASKDNDYSDGGNSFDLSFGYVINENFGVLVSYTPEYDYEFKDDDGDYKNGGQYSILGHYERKLSEEMILNAYAGKLVFNRNSQDGDKLGSHDSHYLATGVNLTYAVNPMIDLLPGVGYWVYNGDNEDIEATVSSLRLAARVKF